MPSPGLGLYVHWPFCRHRCGYCAFAVTTRGHGDPQRHENYGRSVVQELERRLERQAFDPSTLYIGGGSPSRHHPEAMESWFEDLKRTLNPSELQESTFELNPEDVNEQPLWGELLHRLGFTRLSLGVQTLNPEGLKVLEREVSATSIEDSLLHLRQDFGGPLSVDFILAWPGEEVHHVDRDLDFIARHRPEHISAYLLNLEPGTRLTRDVNQGKWKSMDADQEGRLWEHFRKGLKDLGYDAYEISSFALDPIHHSRHNVNTWRGAPYLGIGSGAVSRVGSCRWTNLRNTERYLQSMAAGQWPVESAEWVGGAIAWQEQLLLQGRHQDGIDLDELEAHFNAELPSGFYDNLRTGVDQGDLKWEDRRLAFSEAGWSRFDGWVSHWMVLLDDLPLG